MSKDTQHAALQSYLNSLLADDEPDTALEPEAQLHVSPAPLAPKPVAVLEQPAVLLSVPALMPHVPLISEEQISQLPVSMTVQNQQVTPLDLAPAAAIKTIVDQATASGSSFECLLFDVAGLTLAVPLAALGSIYSFEPDELTPLFGQPDWFIGILATAQGNLKVLETARWVMPERYTENMRTDLKYVISINGYDWGLAVHNMRNSIRIEPGDIKWRSDRGKRAWLAGTVIEHMCALLDVEVLAELITGKEAPEATL